MKYVNAALFCLSLYVIVLLHSMDQKLAAIQQSNSRFAAFSLSPSASAQSIAKEVVQQVNMPPHFDVGFKGSGSDSIDAYQYVNLRVERYDGLATDLTVTAPDGIVASCKLGDEAGNFSGGTMYFVHLAAAKGHLPTQFTFTIRYSTARAQQESRTFALVLNPGAGEEQARVIAQE